LWLDRDIIYLTRKARCKQSSNKPDKRLDRCQISEHCPTNKERKGKYFEWVLFQDFRRKWTRYSGQGASCQDQSQQCNYNIIMQNEAHLSTIFLYITIRLQCYLINNENKKLSLRSLKGTAENDFFFFLIFTTSPIHFFISIFEFKRETKN
jgi:hypothetical protein